MKALGPLLSILLTLSACGAPVDEEIESGEVSEALGEGTPFGLRFATGGYQLIKINPATGVTSVIGTIPFASLNSLILQTSYYDGV